MHFSVTYIAHTGERTEADECDGSETPTEERVPRDETKTTRTMASHASSVQPAAHSLFTEPTRRPKRTARRDGRTEAGGEEQISAGCDGGGGERGNMG